MSTTDKRVDAYITKSADFSKGIMLHLRALMHKACPDVTETIKWGFPNFEYKGVLCSMAAFKQHCSFGFWRASLMTDPNKLFIKMGNTAMGHFGRIEKLKDLPSDKIIIAYIKEAVKLNEKGIKPVKDKTAPKTALVVPAYFKTAVSKNKKALKTFEGFSDYNKKEYVNWVTEAKTEEIRNKRLAQAIEWMAEGKIRNWKYVKK